MFSYFVHELKSKRAAFIGWTLGMSFFVLLYVGIYPSFVEQLVDFEGLLDLPIYQALGISTMSTYAGWVSSTVLNFMPIIVGIFAITAGTGSLAGEEESGVLENIAALPISRWQIVTTKFIAILTVLVAIISITGLVTLGVTAWVNTQIEISLDNASIFAAILAALPLLVFMASIAMFFGALLPSRSTANSFAMVVLIAGYLSNNLFDQVEILEDFKFLSPFHYFNASDSAFTAGVVWGDVLTLSLLSITFFALASLSFQRRDLMTHRWLWNRPRVSGSD